MKKYAYFLITTLFAINILAVVEAEPNAVEAEPNNEMKDANSITPKVMMSGQLSDGSDDEWFFFEISSSDVLTITLNNPETNGHSKIITVYDAEKKKLYTQTFDVDESSNEEVTTSSRIGLKQAGKFFIEMRRNPVYGFRSSEYQMTLNLENQPPFTATTTCPATPSFSATTGMLEIPAVDVKDALGGSVSYKASLKLTSSPTEDLMFKVTEASPK